MAGPGQYGERYVAKMLGNETYFTGRPCVRGHIANRVTASGKCLSCRKEDNLIFPPRWRAANHERHLALCIKWHRENPERHKQLTDLSRNRDREKFRASRRAQYARKRAKAA